MLPHAQMSTVSYILDVKNENEVKYCVQKAGVSADILIPGPLFRVHEGPLLP